MPSPIEVEIVMLLEKALGQVSQFKDQAKKQLKDIDSNTGLTAFIESFRAAEAVGRAAFESIEGFLGKVVDQGVEAEKAQFALANSLRLTGDYSAAAVDHFEKLADQLSRTSVFAGNTVLAAAGLGKQFQLTNQETDRAVKVAADLAAATGTDLNEAMLRVSQTFNGFVDRSLQKMIPGLKNMGVQALLSGQGLALIEQRVRGSAAALGNTFFGALTQAKNAFDDVYEAIGKIITSSPQIITAIKAIQKGFQSLQSAINDQKKTISSGIGDAFVSLVKAGPAIVESLRVLDTVISNVVLTFVALGRTIGAILAGIQSFRDGVKGAGQQIVESLKADISSDFSKNAARIEGVYGNLEKAAQVAAVEVDKQTVAINKSLNNIGGSSSGEAARAAGRYEPLVKSIQELVRAEAEINDAVDSRVKEVTARPIEGLITFLFKGQEELDKTKQQIDNVIQGLRNNDSIQPAIKKAAILFAESAKERLEKSLGDLTPQLLARVGSALTKGADGAKQAIASIGGAIADTILPGIGGFVTDMLNLLAEGPQKVKEMVQGFVRAIPDVIKNIADALPVLIETLVEELPPALAKAMPTVAIGFSTALIKNIPNIVKGFIDGLKDVPKAIVDGIKDAIGNLGGLFGGGGGGGSFIDSIPIIGDVAGFLGFASGGDVPEKPQYRNDGLPIRVSGGERILTKEQKEAMDRGQLQQPAAKMPDIVINVGLQQFAKIMFDARRAGYQV